MGFVLGHANRLTHSVINRSLPSARTQNMLNTPARAAFKLCGKHQPWVFVSWPCPSLSVFLGEFGPPAALVDEDASRSRKPTDPFGLCVCRLRNRAHKSPEMAPPPVRARRTRCLNMIHVQTCLQEWISVHVFATVCLARARRATFYSVPTLAERLAHVACMASAPQRVRLLNRRALKRARATQGVPYHLRAPHETRCAPRLA